MKLVSGALLFFVGIFIFTLSISDWMRFLFGFPCLAGGFLMLVNATRKKKPTQPPIFHKRPGRGRRRSRDGGNGDPDDADGGGNGDGGGGGDGGD